MIKQHLIITFLISFSTLLIAQVPVREEPMHKPVFENKYIRVLDVWIQPGDTSLYHVHDTPSLFVAFENTLIGNQLLGSEPVMDKFESGQTWYDSFAKPKTHRVWNRDKSPVHVDDIEILTNAPISLTDTNKLLPLKLIGDYQKARTYNLNLSPNENLTFRINQNPIVIFSYKGRVDVKDSSAATNLTEHIVKKGSFQWIDHGSTVILKNQNNENMNGYIYEIKQ
jgi:hypothetical protein